MYVAAFHLFSALAVFLPAIIVHEYAHGWAAYKLGDSTAKDAGRLTLNPLAHIDPIGTIVVPLGLTLIKSPVLLGWAKPVPINFLNLRNPKKDIIIVGLSGPLSNILMAIGASFILRFLSPQGTFPPSVPFLNHILSYFIVVNLVLAIFNIMPVPPLDGSRIIFGLLPQRFARVYAGFERYGMLILLALLYFGLPAQIIWPTVSFLCKLLGINLIM